MGNCKGELLNYLPSLKTSTSCFLFPTGSSFFSESIIWRDSNYRPKTWLRARKSRARESLSRDTTVSESERSRMRFDSGRRVWICVSTKALLASFGLKWTTAIIIGLISFSPITYRANLRIVELTFADRVSQFGVLVVEQFRSKCFNIQTVMLILKIPRQSAFNFRTKRAIGVTILGRPSSR